MGRHPLRTELSPSNTEGVRLVLGLCPGLEFHHNLGRLAVLPLADPQDRTVSARVSGTAVEMNVSKGEFDVYIKNAWVEVGL